MFNPADYYEQRGGDTLHQAIAFRAGFGHLSDDEIAEMYSTDSIVSKIVDTTSYLLSSYEWDLHSADAELSSLVRDFLNSLDLLEYLGAAYRYSILFEDAYLVLADGWFDNLDNLKIIGVEHRKTRTRFDDTGVYFQQRNKAEYKYQPRQLLEVRAIDSFRKIFFHYHRYLEALEQAGELSGNNSLLTISDETLMRDNSRYQNPEQIQEQQNAIASNALSELNRNGAAVFAGNPKIQIHQREARDALSYVEICREAFVAAVDLPEFVLFGKSSNGSGLAGIHDFVDRQLSKMVKMRRSQCFSKIVNFIISRFLLSINENPEAVKWNPIVQQAESALEKAEIENLRSKTEVNRLASGVLTVSEVRNQFLGRSSSQDIIIEDSAETTEYQKELITSVQNNYVNELWNNWRSRTNMNFDQLVQWRNSPESKHSLNDYLNLENNIILQTISKEELSRSSKLQRWMGRSVKRLKHLSTLPRSKDKTCAMKCWGFDCGGTFVLPTAATQSSGVLRNGKSAVRS